MSNLVGGYEIGEGSTPKKRSKPRSEVWEHFTKLDVDGGTRAKCKYCHTDLSYTKGTTSHLRRHLASCSEAPEQVRTQFSEKPKRKIISKPLVKAKKQKRAGINQPPTIAFAEEVRNSDITSEKIWEVQVKNAILADFPFAHPNVKKAWSSLMVMDMEKEICVYYQRQKGELISELGNLTSGVSFSCEIIEAGWISISAHFINDDFKLVKRLIGFKKVDFETPNSCKVDIIERCISEWKLENKNFSINTTLDWDLHQCVKQKFEKKWFFEMEDMVFSCLREKIAKHFGDKDEIIKFLRDALETEEKTREFNATAKEMGLSPIDKNWLKRLAIRWQWETRAWKICCSAAKLFKDALIYKAVFDKCAVTETGEAPVSKVDSQIILWQDMESYIASFDVFNNMMGTLSNFKYPTSNLCIRSIAELMTYYFVKRYVPHIFCVSCILDPRYKLKFFEYYFKKRDLEYWAETYVKTCELFETLFVAHAREGSSGGSSSSSGTVDTQEEDFGESEDDSEESEDDSEESEDDSEESEDYLSVIEGFSQYLQNLKCIDRSEMNQYLIEDTVDLSDADFDVLEWWKENRLRYPVLSKMARTLLAVPVCVYSVEEDLGLDLSVLKGVDPELVEAVICSKDWILTNA